MTTVPEATTISSRRLFRKNAPAFLLFGIAYALVGAVLVGPLLAGGLWLAMKVSGIGYLAAHNVTTLLACPATWVFVIFAIVVIAFYALLEVSASILFCHLSYSGEKASVWGVTKEAFTKAVTVVKKGNWPFILVLLLVLPLTNLVLGPSFIGTIEIPDFIMTFIMYKQVLVALFVLVAVALFAFSVRIMYALHFFVLEGCNFREAVRKSSALGKGHHVRDLVYCLLRQLAYTVVAFLVLAVLALVLFGLGVLFQNVGQVLQVLTVGVSAAVLVLLAVVALAVMVCGTPICYVFVSSLYYRHRQEQQMSDTAASQQGIAIALTEDQMGNMGARPAKGKRVAGVVFALVMYGVAIGLVGWYYQGIDVSSKDASQEVGIVAHRCGANYAPENTVAALNKAADMGATWCEIDVQMCADGSIIVTHDTNLERTAGLDANTWDVTYDQVKVLDSGSKFSSEFAGEPIPLLEDMIKAAKARGVKLQIEIKPTGHDEGIEQRTVEIVRELGFQDQCYVASMSYDCLQKIRSCGSDVRVLYIMALAYGDIASIPEADAYSVESTFATADLAENVHTKEGAELCAWTVNSESFMQRAISNGADQLVTDEVGLAKEVVSGAKTSESMLLDVLGAFRKTAQ